MTQLKQAGRRRPIAVAATFAVAVAALALTSVIASTPTQVSGEAPKKACANASKPAAEAGRSELRKAVRCLVNKQRARRGAPKLRRNPALKKAAQRHAKTMVATSCLAHQCGDGPSLKQRLRRAGYFNGARAWQFAENTGCAASAEAMVRNWFKSADHRRNLLEPAFREIGVGAVSAPAGRGCGSGYASFAVVLGWRDLR